MATVTTHDLPTLTGFWQGHDLALKRAVKLYPNAGLAEADAAAREQDRRVLVEDLKHRGVLGEGAASQPEAGDSCPLELREEILDYLAQSKAALMEVRLEEIFGVPEQQNLPGTQAGAPQLAGQVPPDPGTDGGEPGACPAGGPAE